jgi:DNA polymerase III subunit gamma/tau
MSQALYRKWRPRQWDEVVAQEHVVQTLRNAVRTGRTAHAYLLAGPRGTGKTTTARLLAKALNCLAEEPPARPATSASTAWRSTPGASWT